jgi:hypothetical protein
MLFSIKQEITNSRSGPYIKAKLKTYRLLGMDQIAQPLLVQALKRTKQFPHLGLIS